MSDAKTCGTCGHCADRHGKSHRDGVCLLMGVAVKKNVAENSTRPCGARYVNGEYVPVEWVDKNDPDIVDPIASMNLANKTIKKLADAAILSFDTIINMVQTTRAHRDDPTSVNSHLSMIEQFVHQQRQNFEPLSEDM